MKTFDAVASLDNVDTNAFAISKALSKKLAANNSERLEIYAPTFKPTVSMRNSTTPIAPTLMRYFRSLTSSTQHFARRSKQHSKCDNVIASAQASQTLAEQFMPTRDSPEVSDDQIIDQVVRAHHMPQPSGLSPAEV